jgi:pimeloyl-CoA synthetase
MGDRNKVSREVLQAVKPAIRKAVVRMADDDFRRGARVTNIDWSDTTEFNEVKVNAGAETLTYTIAFDVMGRWA